MNPSPDDSPSMEERQKAGIRKTVFILIGIIVLFLGLFFHKMLSPRIMSATELRNNGVIIHQPSRIIKPFQLRNHKGEIFTEENLRGKWTWAYFGFTHCPDICPTTLAILSRMYEQLDADLREKIQIIMVSVDPARDTEEKLAEYIPHFNKEFVGVSGDFMEIIKLASNVNIAMNKVITGDDYTVDHSSDIVLINPEGNYFGLIRPPFELARLKTIHTSIVKTH